MSIDRPEEKGIITRRNLLVSGAALATLGAGSSLYHLLHIGEKPYKIAVYNHPGKKAHFSGSDLEIVTNIGHDYFDRIVKDEERRTSNRVKGLNVFLKDIHTAYIPLKPQNVEKARKIIELEDGLIKDGLEFWQHPKLRIPNYRFEIPFATNDLPTYPSFDKSQDVSIYAIKSIESRYAFDVVFISDKGLVRGEGRFTEELDGQMSRTYSCYFDTDALDVSRECILWAISREPLRLFDSAAKEIFHTQVSEHTDRMVGERLKRESCENDIRPYLNYFKSLEESLVHGIATMWYIKASERFGLGFSKEQIERKTINTQARGAVYAMALDMSPQRVISMYIDDNNGFAEEIERMKKYADKIRT